MDTVTCEASEEVSHMRATRMKASQTEARGRRLSLATPLPPKRPHTTLTLSEVLKGR